jgi:hypothetical protein
MAAGVLMAVAYSFRVDLNIAIYCFFSIHAAFAGHNAVVSHPASL